MEIFDYEAWVSIVITSYSIHYTKLYDRLFSPCTLKTSRGIGIGSSKEVVLQEYKDEVQLGLDEGESDKIIVGTVYGGIIFTLDGDSVISIYIGASAE